MAKIVVLNGQRVNYDGLVDYSVLGADVAVYDHSTPEEILPRLAGAEIAVTKELVLTEEETAYLEAPYVPHPLAGVMAQNKPAAAKEKHVWSTGDQKIGK